MGPGVPLGNAVKTEDHGRQWLILASLSPLFSLFSLCYWRLISSVVNLMHASEHMVALVQGGWGRERGRGGEGEREGGGWTKHAHTHIAKAYMYVSSGFSLVYMWIEAFIFIHDSSQTELKHHRSFHSHLCWYWMYMYASIQSSSSSLDNTTWDAFPLNSYIDCLCYVCDILQYPNIFKDISS